MDYTQLKSEVIDWSHRTDIDSKMDLFTELAESVINKDLRTIEMEKRTFITVDDAFVDLPDDYIELRALELELTGRRAVLKFFTPQQLDIITSNGSGNPYGYTIQGNQIEIRPAADSSAPISGEITYIAEVPTLVTNADNIILDKYPLIYLSAMMIQVYLYTQDAEELSKWTESYNSQIKMANKSAGRYVLPQVQ